MRFWPLSRLAVLSAAPLALASCADPAPLYVDQAWISASSDANKPSAGYFTVHGGADAVELRAVQSDVTQRIEMHDNIMENGMMTMKPLNAAPVPAKSTVAFAPGGKHLMIYGLNPGAVQLGKASLTFIFSNGDRLIVDTKIQKQGQAPSVKDGDDMHNEHEGH